jgi:uncharacterized protein HemX
MSITAKLQAALSLILTIAVIAFGVYGWYQKQRVEHVSEERNVASGDAAAYKTHNTEYKKVVTAERATKEQVDEVVARNRDWADEPLPVDVADLLRDPARTSE